MAFASVSSRPGSIYGNDGSDFLQNKEKYCGTRKARKGYQKTVWWDKEI